MRVTSTVVTDPKVWDTLAASLGGGYFHSYAAAAYDAAGGGDPLFLQALDAGGACVGVVTGTLAASRRWPFSRYCNWAMLLSLPAVADGTEAMQRRVLEAVEEHLRGRGVFSVRIYSYDAMASERVLGALGYQLSPRTEFYVDLTPTVGAIWGHFSGTRRTDLRKAEKLGVVTRLENTLEALDLVSTFYAQSMRRHEVVIATPNEQATVARRRQLESGHGDVLVTYWNGQPVNAALFGIFSQKPYYLTSGASEAGYKCCGPAHLLWTAIQMYKDRGAACLNLGAALEDQTGLHRFKQDFGATVVSAPIGVKRLSTLGSALHRIRSLLGR